MTGNTNEHGQPVGDEVPGWEPRTPPTPVELQGRYVRLEPISPDHAESLFEALCGPEDAPLWTYRRTDAPPDVTAMARDVVAPLTSPAGGSTLVIVPEGGTASGLATYWRVDADQGVVEISGVLLSRRLQRTRAATEALHLLMKQAFEGWGYRRVEWKCDSLNEPSRRAATRLGFTYEGRHRQHMVTKGRNRDTDWFSVTDAEWPAVGQAHQQWLDPANFDADGAQRTRLSDLTPRDG